MINISIGFKDFVKSGETVFLKDGKGSDISHDTAKVMGWGRYAPVQVGRFVIRRDGIMKNERGDWIYQFPPEMPIAS